MVITPDIPNLEYKIHNGIKYFELIAEPVEQEILPRLKIKAWGYNGSVPGPTIQVYKGDRVIIRVINHLPEATSVHWHGLNVPNNMDGVPDVEPTPKIKPGEFFDYSFKITNEAGTHMYHSHFNSHKQIMMGLQGAFIILEKQPLIRSDYFYMLQEFNIKDLKMGEVNPGTYEIDPSVMDFNFFTMNGRCFPNVTPINIRLGETFKVRFGNVMHDAHPMHIHGHQFTVTASDGNPLRNKIVKNTINVASGETYDVMIRANNQGIWPFHCHIPHHMSNNMTQPLGGMTTIIKYQSM